VKHFGNGNRRAIPALSPQLFLLLILAPIGLLTTAYVIWPLLRPSPHADDVTPGRREGGRAPATGSAPSSDSSDSPDSPDPAAAALNREIVAERRTQLDRELALLPADSPERDRLILEFSAAALADLETSAAPVASRARRAPPRRITAALLAALLVAAPLAFYRIAGVPDAASPDFAQRAQPQDLPTLVAELEKRLQAEPEQPDGWLLLGRSRMSLGDLAGATAAMERALQIDSKLPGLAAQIRVDLADALAQGASSRLAGRPWQLIQEALQIDGANQKALALAGAYQVTQGNRPGALVYWEPLLAQLPPGSEQHAQIASFIDDLKSGRAPGSAASPAPRPDAGSGAGAGSAAPADPGPGGGGPVLRGRVDIDPALAGKAGAGDTVFVAVRAVDQGDKPVGPPVAVLRARVSDLPLQFELSDRQAMSPAAKLSDQKRVVLVARVSRSGAAAAGSGDLEGRSEVVASDAQAVPVLIDRVVP
jgi:cytochrome c-type biogenesis protein CcmH